MTGPASIARARQVWARRLGREVFTSHAPTCSCRTCRAELALMRSIIVQLDKRRRTKRAIKDEPEKARARGECVTCGYAPCLCDIA